MRASTLASSGTGGWCERPPDPRNSTRLFRLRVNRPTASPINRTRSKVGRGGATQFTKIGKTGYLSRPPSRNSSG
ncbi:hypothetical protein D3C81_2135000 [compost metagenome]